MRNQFIVNLRGLIQGLAPGRASEVGYPPDDGFMDAFRQSHACAYLWLRPGRLSDYRHEDFPEIGENQHLEIVANIARFDDTASRATRCHPVEIDEACRILLYLKSIFHNSLTTDDLQQSRTQP